ncbi:hypothetical protein [Roseofilum capinflatum]|uniref:Uncharacterized protein n=1 Tax=Roseofilum capinflatum BLCC-M114 TaxID=3022440 RepID=A0ABT7BBD8_9CYAN|nr:hypothetical protein [Roseofilum capinflatum]MDJ1175836.1 hypothetical protein [Roseofilum capinflatum BLCC-M114]
MPDSTEITPPQNGQSTETSGLQRRFSDFVIGLGEVLTDMTALEVNTMVVAQITGSKFVPQEAYRYIYEIPEHEGDEQYFYERKIPPALYHRYYGLRRKMLMEYRQVLNSPTNDLFDAQERLPNPDDPKDEEKLQNLLSNGRFLRGLRKLLELKAALDSQDLSSESTDIIYAQTVMQLDGDIINRYHEQLLGFDQKELLIQIHNEGVSSGERQWRGLLEFMVGIVQDILEKSTDGRFRLPAATFVNPNR